jgi:hypothetical protein
MNHDEKQSPKNTALHGLDLGALVFYLVFEFTARR